MSKYNNKKCDYKFQGEVYLFDSRLERQHAIELFRQLLQMKISNLTLQPEFQLCEPTVLNTNATKSGKTKQQAIIYKADFSYMKQGNKVVADSKGIKTPTYSLKKRLFLSQLKKHRVDEFQELYRAETIIYKHKKEMLI